MPKKQPSSGTSTSLRVGNISGIDGDVNVAGGSITTRRIIVESGAAKIKQLFDEVYADIETRPKTSPTHKKDLKAEVKEIQTTVTAAARKHEKPDQEFLSKRFRNIARMAPDILETVVATLANPLLGLGTVARKIAARAQEEAGG